MTRDEARAYFKSKGLAYDNINLPDLHFLATLLNKHFIRQREELMRANREGWLYWNRVNPAKYYKGEFTPATERYQRMRCAFLTASGEYFTAREVISFNRDGFIGFCGDADSDNAQPVLEAFVEWCDWLCGEDSEESRQLRKQTPMEVTDIHVDEFYCPACGEEVTGEPLYYCPMCGQAFIQPEEEMI